MRIKILVISLFLFLSCFLAPNSFCQEQEKEETLAITREELREIVEESVSARIRPLQREIQSLKEETKIHDIMGGVGVIMGLGGVIFYFLGVKKKEQNEQQK